MVIILLVLAHFSCAAAFGCQSPQYLEVGQSGTIDCTFSEDFDSISWYDSGTSEGPPTLTYDGQTKEGRGYRSGEFDIKPDGSLIINNVSVKHDSRFLVYETIGNRPTPRSYEITVVPFIRPTEAYPLINDCAGNGRACYIQWRPETSIICRLENARPPIPLRLLAGTTNANTNITDKASFRPNGDTWTSSISATDPHMTSSSSYLALVICEADDQLNLLERTQTITLVHDAYKDTSAFSPTKVAVERNEKITFECSDSDFEMFVWDKISSDEDDINMVSFSAGSSYGDFIASHEYGSESGTLTISRVQIEHEGVYRCTYSDGSSDSVTLRELTVVVNPVPKVLTIEGCPTDAYCLIEANYEGTLSCSVKGIYPDVELQWKSYREESADEISFHSRDVETRLVGDTYDITLTTKYIARKTPENRLTVECMTDGANGDLFNLTIKADLIFSGLVDQVTTNKYSTVSGNNGTGLKIIPVIVVVVAIIVVIALASVLLLLSKAPRGRKLPLTPHAHKELHDSHEKISMMNNSDNTNSDSDGLFISQLKSNYENLYCSVNPIPFLPSNYTVHELFVEGGVEYMSRNKKDPWQSLESYKNIFDNPKLNSNRWIIEGDPGYGKSTLCLQFAYEWSNKLTGSYMCDVDILLLIRLRQLKGVSSIYEAVKRFLLPKDSKFTIDDIKKFIENSSSVLVILDGFDEHPSNDSLGSDSDIINILKRTMLPDCKVVLTTRSSQLPKDYAGQTNRIRLTGFKTNAQEQYLEKAVLVNGNSTGNHTIKEWLEENPVLSDLCEIPLFFVMYAHLSLESSDLRQCTSVTSFFRYMITCLHHHLRLKSKDENVDAIALNENFHKDLDKLCFEYLNGHSYNPDIPKDDLITTLGKELVDQYLSIGIFRQEKSTVVSTNPGVQASEHVKTVTFIRFYHSLFYEWFAAHHLADCLDELHLAREQGKPAEKSTILEDLDPEQLQYVYRFACGLRQTAAKLLLDHLKLVHGVDTFSLLCILEQAGNVDKILDNVKEICSSDVGLQIRGFDTKILQRSVIQLMEIAVNKKILIPKLTFLKSFKTVDISKNEIVLSSGARLPALNGIKHLLLEQNENDFTEESFDDLLKYMSICSDLELVSFVYSSVPYQVKIGSGLNMIKDRNITVDWFPSEIRYSLNVETGYWTQSNDGPQITREDFHKVSTSLRMMSKP